MIPSARWFPSSLSDRAAWFANFNKQFQLVGSTLGFTAAELTKMGADNTLLQDVAAVTTELDAYAKAVRQFRIIMTEGNNGDPTPTFPATPTYEPPSGTTTGIFERLDDAVKRIRVAPNYTDEIGALLGIIPKQSGDAVETELKPAIKALSAADGYKFTVNVTRLGMEAFKVQVQRKDSTAWEDAAFATNNPVQVTISPAVAGDPERIMVRAVLLQKNNPIGQPSDPTYVTVNP